MLVTGFLTTMTGLLKKASSRTLSSEIQKGQDWQINTGVYKRLKLMILSTVRRADRYTRFISASRIELS